jgi:hypothetical protein
VEIKIDGCSLGIRFRNYAKTVLKVRDIRSFVESFHGASLGKLRPVQKIGGFAVSEPAPEKLQAGYVRCLQTLRARGHFEFNRLAFVQRLVSFRLNRGKMDEHILAGLALNESEALAGIKPLHCSLFFHCNPFLRFYCLSYLVLSHRLEA